MSILLVIIVALLAGVVGSALVWSVAFAVAPGWTIKVMIELWKRA